MKFITVGYYNSLVDGILKEKEKQAKSSGHPFDGLTEIELTHEINKHMVGEWKIKSEQPVKFTKADINSVASGRFYRTTGVKMLMGLLIIILAVAVAMGYIPNMTALHYNIYYTFCGAIGLGFIYIYSRKQARVRKELWRQIGREETEEEK